MKVIKIDEHFVTVNVDNAVFFLHYE